MLGELEADRARVAELQTRILDLERALSDLRLEQSIPQRRLDAYQYPVLTLPNELVSEIFVRVLPPYPDFPQLIGRLSPIPLTQICQRWREIALGTPALWSAISSFGHGDEPELDIFELWLKRSRHCPISIKLGTESLWASDALVDVVIPHRARWQYLKIDIEAENLPIFDGPMPLLRHLELMVEPGSGTGISLHASGMPMLRTLVLRNIDALEITFPWTQLTSLTLPAAHPSKYVPILVQTRNLVHCELRATVYLLDVAEPPQAIRLPRLESLTFIQVGGAPVTEFLLTLVVPALRTLEIPESYLAPDPIGSLTAFFTKTGCKLEELRLTGIISVPAISYLEAFPSLRQLSFDNVADDGEDSEDSDSSDD
ncbi:hypothetical protein DFH06DRAFT_1446606 [Mycena polygramma]|nr:hypothetical protein DFH06DRAFT_1446606 [Mycena polygramma]